MADALEELQSQIHAFDLIRSSRPPHPGPPGRITPQRTVTDVLTQQTPPRV